VRVWDVTSGRVVSCFEAELTESPLLVINAEGSLLALTASESRMSLWEIAQGRKRWTVSITSAVTDLAFAKQGTTVIARCADNSVKELALADGSLLRKPAVTERRPK
jgi:hypothetical protein